MAVPAATEPLSAELVASFTAYHEALTQLTAASDGGDLQADIIDGMNAFNATSQAFADVQARVDAHATECGIRT